MRPAKGGPTSYPILLPAASISLLAPPDQPPDHSPDRRAKHPIFFAVVASWRPLGNF